MPNAARMASIALGSTAASPNPPAITPVLTMPDVIAAYCTALQPTQATIPTTDSKPTFFNIIVPPKMNKKCDRTTTLLFCILSANCQQKNQLIFFVFPAKVRFAGGFDFIHATYGRCTWCVLDHIGFGCGLIGDFFHHLYEVI